MTRKIGVIGIGHVGAAVAHHIIAEGVADELVLIDPNEKKVVADATDFEDAMSNLPSHTNITVNDYSAIADADVVISAVGKISLQKDNKEHDRFIELPFTKYAVQEVSENLKECGYKGVLVDITNPCDVITMMYQKFTGFPKHRVIGTGTLLDSSRMRRAVAKKLQIDPRSVAGFNLGEHGNSQFTAWSTVRVLGRPIEEVAKERGIDLEELDEAARAGGYTVYHGKHYTNYGIASAAVRLAKIIISDARAELPVSHWNEKHQTYLSYPAIVGRSGVIEDDHLHLTPEEQDKLKASAHYIKTRFEDTVVGMEKEATEAK